LAVGEAESGCYSSPIVPFSIRTDVSFIGNQKTRQCEQRPLSWLNSLQSKDMDNKISFSLFPSFCFQKRPKSQTNDIAKLAFGQTAFAKIYSGL
jgi:hypothetical protein